MILYVKSINKLHTNELHLFCSAGEDLHYWVKALQAVQLLSVPAAAPEANDQKTPD